jgi:hypothetical protein
VPLDDGLPVPALGLLLKRCSRLRRTVFPVRYGQTYSVES